MHEGLELKIGHRSMCIRQIARMESNIVLEPRFDP